VFFGRPDWIPLSRRLLCDQGTPTPPPKSIFNFWTQVMTCCVSFVSLTKLHPPLPQPLRVFKEMTLSSTFIHHPSVPFFETPPPTPPPHTIFPLPTCPDDVLLVLTAPPSSPTVSFSKVAGNRLFSLSGSPPPPPPPLCYFPNMTLSCSARLSSLSVVFSPTPFLFRTLPFHIHSGARDSFSPVS